MYFDSKIFFKVAFLCFATGITAKDAGKAADHDDTLDLLEPGPATIHMFRDDNFCNNSTLQRKTSFETDRCFNINPLVIKEFSFRAPPVCKNGTVAKYTAFQEKNCFGDIWHSWEVTDMHLDQCLRTTADIEKLRSFALVCDNIRRSNSKARLVLTLLLLFALSLAVLGLLLASIRFGLALVSKTLNSLAWGLRRLVTIAKVRVHFIVYALVKTTTLEVKAKKGMTGLSQWENH
ncbi:hypothetical protein N431DRAFT_475325 [Stipitochalara longipes BDJ]|nr:hypothetical protein N431DRAFT_475325 [Stipitochalara longipes BDJ]